MVTCREYTLLRDDESSTPKGWIRGNTKIDPVLEVVTNNYEGKPGVEIKIESLIERRISLVDQNTQKTEQISMHSIIESGLTAGGKNASPYPQTVFSTAVNPLVTHCHKQKEFDLTKPRFAAYKQERRVHLDAVYWIDVRLAERKGLKFFQTTSNAIILYDTLPPICIERGVSIKTHEVKYTKIKKSPRSVPTVTLRDNWQKDWSSDAAASSSSIKQIQSNQNDHLASTVRPVTL